MEGTTFESLVNLLMASGFTRAVAEHEVRRSIAELEGRIGAQAQMIEDRDRTIAELTAAIRQIDPASVLIPQAKT